MSLHRSLAFSVASKYLELGLAFMASLVLARLLTPQDFGIYSIAASIALIGYTLRNFGVAQYIIQVDTLDDDTLRNAFGVTLIISWLIALILVAVAGPIAAWYANDGVASVLYFLSINFLLLPFGAVTDALFRRNMEFGKLAVISVCAALAGVAVGIGSALAGAGYLSIVWSTNATTIVSILLTLYFRPPGLPWAPGFNRMRQVAGFGVKVGLTDLLLEGGNAGSEIIIGKLLGLTSLGLYSRGHGAFQLFQYAFVEAIRPVVLPFLSQSRRDQGSLAPVYVQIVSYVAIFMAPFFVFLLFNAADVILVLYGDQWHAAVPVLEILCFAGFLLIPTIFFDQLLLAHSRPGLGTLYQAVFQATRLIALLLLVRGSLQEAALALVIGALVKALSAIYLARSRFQVSVLALSKSLVPCLLVSSAVVAGMWLSTRFTADWPSPLLRLLSTGSGFVLVWLLGVYATGHPIAGEITRLLRRVRRPG